jgi:oligopeptide transport system ATP-binding protein
MSSTSEFVLEARGLCKTYKQGRWWQKKIECRALDDVNLTLRAGTTLSLVGQSGCGKTTLAMCLVGLEKVDAGQILVGGDSLESVRKPSSASVKREIQLIFQDSAGALNPRMSAVQIIEEPLLIRGQGSRFKRWALAAEMMRYVGISPKWMHRLPHEFSGGQRQRLAIARALVLQPKVLILDEVFVGLDLSIQGQIANLLLELQQAYKLSYICISHNLALAGQMSDTIAIMDQGRIVEEGKAEELFNYPQHPTTKALMVGSQAEQSAFAARAGA